MPRPAPIALLAVCSMALGGCGVGGAKEGPDSNDKRADALACLKEEKGLDARLDGTDAIQVGDARRGPRIRFFLTRGEAEALQFQGRAEGTLQSGSALIYVREGRDDLLEQVEACIDNL
jgi:hypothetical protein